MKPLEILYRKFGHDLAIINRMRLTLFRVTYTPHEIAACQNPDVLTTLLGRYLNIEPDDLPFGCHLCHQIEQALDNKDTRVRADAYLTFIADGFTHEEATIAADHI